MPGAKYSLWLFPRRPGVLWGAGVCAGRAFSDLCGV